MDALDLIRARVEWCEAEQVAILCCPEAILGGLADYDDDPARFAIASDGRQLETVLEPLASDVVTTIVGFTELGPERQLYNSAAVFRRGSVAGVYRKRHPAINLSVYRPGHDTPVFQAGTLTFGIAICNDSNYPEIARSMAARGATVLFVPTNNGLPPTRAGTEIADETRRVDVDCAVAKRMWVVRADVAGRTETLISYGSSAIIDANGVIVQAARELSEDLIVVEINSKPGRPLARSCHRRRASGERRP
jgi:5-aminopentanamidase